jgi:hypothetical protein
VSCGEAQSGKCECALLLLLLLLLLLALDKQITFLYHAPRRLHLPFDW